MNPFEPPSDQASPKKSEPKPPERGIPSGVLFGGAGLFLFGAVLRLGDANGVRGGLVYGVIAALLFAGGVAVRRARKR